MAYKKSKWIVNNMFSGASLLLFLLLLHLLTTNFTLYFFQHQITSLPKPIIDQRHLALNKLKKNYSLSLLPTRFLVFQLLYTFSLYICLLLLFISKYYKGENALQQLFFFVKRTLAIWKKTIVSFFCQAYSNPKKVRTRACVLSFKLFC